MHGDLIDAFDGHLDELIRHFKGLFRVSSSLPWNLITTVGKIIEEVYNRQNKRNKGTAKITLIKYSIVFGTNSTRNEISANFEPTFLEFAKGIPSEYWADKCYILDKDTIAEAINTPSSNDGIGVFFSSQKLSLLSSEFQDDPTYNTESILHCQRAHRKVSNCSST